MFVISLGKPILQMEMLH